MKETNDSIEYKEALKPSLANFITESVNYVLVIFTAVTTMSISIFMDSVNSTCNLLSSGICTFLSIRLQKNQSFKYNYGTDNLESMSMLLCETLLSLGSGAVMVFAIAKLLNPSQPEDSLIIAVLFKALSVIAGIILLIKSYKTYKNTSTKIAKTIYEGTKGCFYFDSVLFFSVLLSYLFRGYEFTAYFEPIVTIFVAIIVIYKAIKRIKDYVKELTFVTLAEEDQLKIMKVLTHHFHDFEKFFSVKSRKSGKYVYIDFLLSFPKETTYGDIVDNLNAMTKELEKTFDNCKVSIIFDSINSLPE